MRKIFKLGEKVKILWDRTTYHPSPNYGDIGMVLDCGTADDGTLLVQLYNFHKSEEWYSLFFPVYAVRSLSETVEDGDVL